jgi:copper chaperone CopZ
MTVASDVKQCLASLKGVEASLSSLATRTQDSESRRTLHETMMEVNEIVEELKKRVGKLEREEPQYKGF